MFSKLLVPLDGSETAEEALAPAFQLAQQFAGEVTLLRVMTPEISIAGFTDVPPPPFAIPGVRAYDEQAEAQAYLESVRTRWSRPAIPVHTRLLSGAPAELIVKVAREARVDLIVMSTHGRSGVSRLLYGSVAEAVLRGAHIPMLLIPSA